MGGWGVHKSPILLPWEYDIAVYSLLFWSEAKLVGDKMKLDKYNQNWLVKLSKRTDV